MDSYQIPAEHAGMTEEESKALANFEAALSDWNQGCIGTTRKENNAKWLWGAYVKIRDLSLDSALTDAERNAAHAACSYMGYAL